MKSGSKRVSGMVLLEDVLGSSNSLVVDLVLLPQTIIKLIFGGIIRTTVIIGTPNVMR